MQNGNGMEQYSLAKQRRVDLINMLVELASEMPLASEGGRLSWETREVSP